MVPQSLTVQSGQGEYIVEFCENVEGVIERLEGQANLFFVVDERVAGLYKGLVDRLNELGPCLYLHAVENSKNLAGVGGVVDWLQTHNATKQSVIVAIGGGIIQDIVSFVSNIYYRGIGWIFVPTTLLSMSDSCIGAKCCLNHGGYKNQLGVFWSARRILIAMEFLGTLGIDEIISGYGEILKLMITSSPESFRRLRKVVDSDGLLNDSLPFLVRDALEVKRGVIEVDEYERDLRRILNYGHTFGHALEKVTEHAIPHGQAVAWGLDFVNYLAVRRGVLSKVYFEEIHNFVQKWLLSQVSINVPIADLIAAARRDKKVLDGQLVLSMLHDTGGLRIVKLPFDRRVEMELQDFLAYTNS